jgi:hypothetical protein
MFWNKETPTVPGLYWFKADDYDVTIVELTVTGDMIIKLHPRPIHLSVEKFLALFGECNWHGPIQSRISTTGEVSQPEGRADVVDLASYRQRTR